MKAVRLKFPVRSNWVVKFVGGQMADAAKTTEAVTKALILLATPGPKALDLPT